MGEFPRNHSLNWFIPALVNMRVGSSLTTIGAEGTTVCPLPAKKSRNLSLISFEVIYIFYLFEDSKMNHKNRFFIKIN
jgi:hypothetical protein